MSLFVWPDDTILSRVETDLGGSIEPTVIRTGMESGRWRQRRRFTSGWRSISASWLFNDSEFEIFKAIVTYKLADGADFFQISLPLGDDSFQNYVVRFVEGKYDFRYQDFMHWRVSARLEMENTQPLITEEELDDIIEP